MTFLDELGQINTIFIDTAPIIYYIEANPHFGSIAKEAIDSFQSERLSAFSSVITLTEVLSKPIETGDEKLARKFAEFLKYGRNLALIEISVDVAERAGRLRGQYSGLRTIDAVQISAAIEVGADAFLTNDKKLKQIKEVKVLVLKDYL
jgi:predicted nucleic acid-binding protein